MPGMTTMRLGKFDVIFTYMLDAEGPFTTTVPYEAMEGKPEVTQSTIVRDAILAEHKERLGWLGKELKA